MPWNKIEFGYIQRKIASLQKQLQRLELQGRGIENRELIGEDRRALNNWLDKELVVWNQDTSFFHAKASNRHQRISIEGMCDAKGIWQEDDCHVKTIVVDYFLIFSNLME